MRLCPRPVPPSSLESPCSTVLGSRPTFGTPMSSSHEAAGSRVADGPSRTFGPHPCAPARESISRSDKSSRTVWPTSTFPGNGNEWERRRMTDQLRDIRELMDDTEAYRDELYRRWTGLLSYRYIGRNHESMNVGESDDTVAIRRDMRTAAGGIMVAPLAISSPEGCQTDMIAVPNPVIASVQIIDPGFDVKTIEVVGSGVVHQGRTMGYGRCKIVDADQPERVIAFIEGQGAVIGTPPEGLDKMDVSD